jgi:hypothetical protein
MVSERDELVMVPVPRSRLLDVYALLARSAPDEPANARGGIAAIFKREQQGAFTVDAVIAWPRDLLERAYRESPSSIKKVLGHLAHHPGERVPITDLAKVVGYKRPQLAGALGAFGRRVKNRYGQKTWPFTGQWDAEVYMWFYTMETSEAEVIRSLEG